MLTSPWESVGSAQRPALVSRGQVRNLDPKFMLAEAGWRRERERVARTGNLGRERAFLGRGRVAAQRVAQA